MLTQHCNKTDTQFYNIGVKCYCENQNETHPFNGIMCGSEGSIHRRVGNCHENERCTGSSDFIRGVDVVNKSELCSLGGYINIQSFYMLWYVNLT